MKAAYTLGQAAINAAVKVYAGSLPATADVTIIGGAGWGLVLSLNVTTKHPGSALWLFWEYTRYSTAGAVTQQRITVDGVQAGGISLDPTTYSQGSFGRISAPLAAAGVHVVNVEAQLAAGGNYQLWPASVPAGYYGELDVIEVRV